MILHGLGQGAFLWPYADAATTSPAAKAALPVQAATEAAAGSGFDWAKIVNTGADVLGKIFGGGLFGGRPSQVAEEKFNWKPVIAVSVIGGAALIGVVMLSKRKRG